MIMIILWFAVFISVSLQGVIAHVCMLQERPDVTDNGKQKWSLPFKERCLCTWVIMQTNKFLQPCTTVGNDLDTEFWFVDDPMPLIQRKNWNKDTLDNLLERTDLCGLSLTTEKSITLQNTQEGTTSASMTARPKTSARMTARPVTSVKETGESTTIAKETTKSITTASQPARSMTTVKEITTPAPEPETTPLITTATTKPETTKSLTTEQETTKSITTAKETTKPITTEQKTTGSMSTATETAKLITTTSLTTTKPLTTGKKTTTNVQVTYTATSDNTLTSNVYPRTSTEVPLTSIENRLTTNENPSTLSENPLVTTEIPFTSPDPYTTGSSSTYGNTAPFINSCAPMSTKTYANCEAASDDGNSVNGVYFLMVGSNVVPAYCYVEHDKKPIDIQRRINDHQNFYQNWTTYESGFGDLCGSFWWGNANIKAYTSSFQKLEIILNDFDGDTWTQTYKEFKITGADYELDLGSEGPSGDAGDNLGFSDGGTFITHDHGDVSNCGVELQTGWWMNKVRDGKKCFELINSNLNGPYQLQCCNHDKYVGIVWKSLGGETSSLKETKMRLYYIVND